MVDFEYAPRLDIGFIDREHQKAFDDANALKMLLESALEASKPVAAEIENLLQTLLSDTINHFALEEKQMRDYQFPALDVHRDEHQRVLKWMEKEHRRWQLDQSVETIVHLQHYAGEQFPAWLLNHIVTMDTAMASYLRSHGGDEL